MRAGGGRGKGGDYWEGREGRREKGGEWRADQADRNPEMDTRQSEGESAWVLIIAFYISFKSTAQTAMIPASSSIREQGVSRR